MTGQGCSVRLLQRFSARLLGYEENVWRCLDFERSALLGLAAYML